jgi:hypothetical protein
MDTRMLGLSIWQQSDVYAYAFQVMLWLSHFLIVCGPLLTLDAGCRLQGMVGLGRCEMMWNREPKQGVGTKATKAPKA